MTEHTAVGVNVAGYLTAELGVGEAARGYVEALAAQGVPMALMDFSHGQASRPAGPAAAGFTRANPHPVNMVCVNAQQVPAFVALAPSGYLDGKRNIGVWWWELPEFPAAWDDRFAPFDEIWTGSEFARAAIARRSPVPVHCMPPVVRAPEGAPLPKSHFGLDEDEFVFLFVFDFLSVFERKNPLGLVEAFARAFPGAERVRLVLKCVNGSQAPGPWRALCSAARDARVTVLDGAMTRRETDGLLGACDCYVSLHRAEGFGLTLAEAMASGRPVIATGWSGNMAFMTPENSFPVPYRLGTLGRDHGPYARGQRWAEPDLDAAARLMRRVYEDPAGARAVGERGRADILARHSPRAVGERMLERLSAEPAGRCAPDAPAWLRPTRLDAWRHRLRGAARVVYRRLLAAWPPPSQ